MKEEKLNKISKRVSFFLSLTCYKIKARYLKEINMKKGLLFIFALGLMTGCTASKENVVSNTPKESITLSAENFSKYVATNSSSSLIGSSYNNVIYYTHFVGADYCKFIDCTVTYTYVANGSTPSGTGTTISLTLSGDGETLPYYVHSQSGNVYYSIGIISASGTVEVYR